MRRLLLPVVAALAGCAGANPPPLAPTTAAAHSHAAGHGHSHAHNHDDGTRMLADAGKLHVALTAHLAKTGNELDVFFETQDEPAKPVAVPLSTFTARAKKVGDEKEFELVFEPAPADERPKGEPAGACSHFVAKAGWMAPDDTLTVLAAVELDGKKRTVVWRKFVPKKYAHVHAE